MKPSASGKGLSKEMLSVQLPSNAVAGGQLQVIDPETKEPFRLLVPADAGPGDIIEVPRLARGAQVAPEVAPRTAASEPAAAADPAAADPAAVDFGPRPVRTTCPSCGAVVQTRTTKIIGLVNWVSCCACIFVGCGAAGCCLIPFCIDDLKNTNHSCPHCNVLIAQHRLSIG